MYSLTPHNPDPSLVSYLESSFIQHVGHSSVSDKYTYIEGGAEKRCGGLIWTLKKFYYPKYKEPTRTGAAKRRRRTYQKGSTSKEGTQVHQEICNVVGMTHRPKVKAKTKAILDHIEKELGHTLQASEIPVFVPSWTIMTQADLITKAPNGDLWMFEVKAAFPYAGYRTQKQEPFMKPPLNDVKSTKYNHWQLQRHYTHQALVQAGLQIKESRVIQVKSDKRKKGLVVKVLPNPAWTKNIPPIRKRDTSHPVIKRVTKKYTLKRDREDQ